MLKHINQISLIKKKYNCTIRFTLFYRHCVLSGGTQRHFATFPERLNISFSRVGIDPTTCRVSSRTLEISSNYECHTRRHCWNRAASVEHRLHFFLALYLYRYLYSLRSHH